METIFYKLLLHEEESCVQHLVCHLPGFNCSLEVMVFQGDELLLLEFEFLKDPSIS